MEFTLISRNGAYIKCYQLLNHSMYMFYQLPATDSRTGSVVLQSRPEVRRGHPTLSHFPVWNFIYLSCFNNPHPRLALLMSLPNQLLLSVVLIFLLNFLHKVYKWQLRLHTFRRNGMPAIPVLITPFSPLRRLFPKSLQTFHFDWSLSHRHTIYSALESDIFVLVSLFDFR